MGNDQSYQALVEKIIPRGRHGPYAVTRCDGLGTVTFSLKSETWTEKDWPEPGTWVMLSQIRKKRLGWRAMLGRFVKPSDEQSETETSKGEKGNE